MLLSGTGGTAAPRRAFEKVESLRNKYADPPLELTDEELLASLHEIATEWEAELDEFFSDED